MLGALVDAQGGFIDDKIADLIYFISSINGLDVMLTIIDCLPTF